MSHEKDLRNRETGIRRLAVNINMLTLELGINSYGNCSYWVTSKCYKCRKCKNSHLKSKVIGREKKCEVGGKVSVLF